MRKYPQSGRCCWKFEDEVSVTRSNTPVMEKQDKHINVKVTTYPRASLEKTQTKLFDGTRKIEPTRSSNVEGIEIRDREGL